MWHAVRTVAATRLRLNVTTGRWILLTSVFVALFAAGLEVSLADFATRRASYESDQRSHAAALDPSELRVYSQVEVGLDRPPEPLGVAAAGTGEEYGSCALIRGPYGPSTIRSREKSNFFLDKEAPFDLTQVLALIGSLLALLLTSDVVAGERENGTLQFVLSQPVRRFAIILGEYVGAMLSLLLPVLLCWLALMASFTLHPRLVLDTTTVASLTAFLGSTVVLLSAFAALGLFVSSRTPHSGTAAMLSFLVWMGAAVVYPPLTSWIARQAVPVQPTADLSSTDVTTKMSFDRNESRSRNTSEFDANLQRRFRQAQVQDGLRSFSPYSAYLVSSVAIAGTDMAGHRRFLDHVSRLDEGLSMWQKHMREKYPRRETDYVGGDGPLDLAGLPELKWHPEPLSSRLSRAAIPFSSMCLWNLFLLYGACVSFLKYDPRFS